MREAPQPAGRSAAATLADDPAAVIGDHVIQESLRVDRIGEVCRADGPEGPVRVRIIRTEDVRRLATRLVRLAGIHSPQLAPVIDRFADSTGRIAVISPLDKVTLAVRRRSGRIAPETIAALGPPLIDGLADLHEADLVHGSVASACVGIDAEGRTWWQDAAVRAPHGTGEPGRADDLARCAAMLRDLGSLPPALHDLVDAVASGRPGAATSAAELAERWRADASAIGIAVPPKGTVVHLPDLVGPQSRARRRTLHRLRLPRRLRGAAGIVALLAAVALVPLARIVPGGAAPLLSVADYLPSHRGQTLVYRYSQSTVGADHSGTVTMLVTDAGVVAGVQSVALQPAQGDATIAAALPFGLAGSTLRIQDGAVNRAVQGGLVRDLVGPLHPGQSWKDERAPLTGFTDTERRTVLGPSGLDLASGHLDHCVAVSIEATSTTSVSGLAGQHASGVLWYCQGVGLARAVLSDVDETDEIDLQSW